MQRQMANAFFAQSMAILGKCQFVADKPNTEAHILYDFTSMKNSDQVNEQR